jgi:glycosyltransferase involved in cell wall biosynthesis
MPNKKLKSKKDNMKTPVLLYVIADSSRSGAPQVVLSLVQGLMNKYQIHCLCPEGWLSHELSKTKAKVHILSPHSRIGNIREIKKWYAQIKPDIIHCHGARGGVYGRLAATKKNCVIYTEHLWTNDFHLKNPLREKFHLFLLRYLGRKTRFTVAVSQVVKDFLVAKKISSKKSTVVIYGGIKPLKFHAATSKFPVLGFLGSLNRTKGIDVLLKAVALLKNDYPELTCRLAGTGPDRSFFQKMVEDLKIENNIKWLGEISDISDFFQSIQIYIQPSYSEAFGLSALEAMSAGKAVIASRTGGLTEIIEDKKNGLLFERGNEKDLAQSIEYLLKNPPILSSLAENAPKRVKEFSLEKMIYEHDALYRKVHPEAEVNFQIRKFASF